jgi:hypothetical protein
MAEKKSKKAAKGAKPVQAPVENPEAAPVSVESAE